MLDKIFDIVNEIEEIIYLNDYLRHVYKLMPPETNEEKREFEAINRSNSVTIFQRNTDIVYHAWVTTHCSNDKIHVHRYFDKTDLNTGKIYKINIRTIKKLLDDIKIHGNRKYYGFICHHKYSTLPRIQDSTK